jgi:hypothetical protein
MIKILKYLVLIRFRKILSKDDYFAILLISLGYIVSAVLVFKNYSYFRNYMFLLFIDIAVYHINRSDLEFLKLHKSYKIILLLEYLFYSSPFYLVFFLKNDFILVFGLLVLKLFLISIEKVYFKIIPYPFQLFNVFWHISFRKYKLIFTLPIIIILLFLAIENKNENIIYFILIILTIISCIPSFEREKLEEIKLNPFDSEKYLKRQFKNSIINTFYLVIPVVVILCVLLQWEVLSFSIIIFIISLINIILKYVYFNNSFLHQIVFIFFIGSSIMLYGIPLLTIPFLYKKAIKNLNTIKYANH